MNSGTFRNSRTLDAAAVGSSRLRTLGVLGGLALLYFGIGVGLALGVSTGGATTAQASFLGAVAVVVGLAFPLALGAAVALHRSPASALVRLVFYGLLSWLSATAGLWLGMAANSTCRACDTLGLIPTVALSLVLALSVVAELPVGFCCGRLIRRVRQQ